jgi:hypothetical protein
MKCRGNDNKQDLIITWWNENERGVPVFQGATGFVFNLRDAIQEENQIYGVCKLNNVSASIYQGSS